MDDVRGYTVKVTTLKNEITKCEKLKRSILRQHQSRFDRSTSYHPYERVDASPIFYHLSRLKIEKENR